ncbi:MAG TPA: carbamate kinase [Candidatus Polarisedimenticolia bacterium]|nr:carbamate kinase [Candidatus Polarisedimenticolia bacterium]
MIRVTRGGRRRLIVVAFGGNALVRQGEDGTQQQQMRHAGQLARSLVKILAKGHDLVLVHGNGPQVGNLLVQVEEAVTKVPPVSLDVCVAQTEGSIGYMLECALRNEMLVLGIDRELACLVTPVAVDPRDPALRNPTKPVGPFYTPYRAAYLRQKRRWRIEEDSGRGYRKVVPSPRPLRILNMSVLRGLLEQRCVVIAGGGGGVPVIEEPSGKLRGIEAVVDKDFTAALMGRDLHADLLLVLTDVDNVCLNYGKHNQQALTRLSLKESERYLRRGQFPPGSMGPKIEAAVEFVRSTGHDVIITSLRRCVSALSGRGGTRITARPEAGR